MVDDEMVDDEMVDCKMVDEMVNDETDINHHQPLTISSLSHLCSSLQ